MNHGISLEELEARIRDVSLDADPEAMRRDGYRVIDWLVERVTRLRASSLGNELRREETEKLLREAMPEQASGFERAFEEYVSKVAPNAIHLDHPRFFAFIPSAPSFASVLADALVAGTNVFAGTWLESSGPSQVELVVIDWFKQMLGLPEQAAGLLVSGGSVANLTALAVARRVALNDLVANAVVYLSDQTHASVDRALRILGFAPRQLHRVATDSGYRLNPRDLELQVGRDREKGLRPFAVVASAGTTNTGAVDPLAEVAEVASRNRLWFHVDAAYGGFAALTEQGRRLLAGIERADSVVLDPHKWFYCPFEAGCAIVRDGGRMRETFRILPDYMRDVAREEQEVNFCDYGVQLTRSFRALKVWMAVKTYGAARLREVIDQCLDLADYASRLVAGSPCLELVTGPTLGVFTFRYVPPSFSKSAPNAEDFLNRLNQDLVARIIAGRRLMLSSTWLGPRHVLRFCVLNHRARKDDVREALKLIEESGRESEADVASLRTPL
ncbi:MAG TPA: aminotransferase class I/II-fold pyridoxal phosphate-dependent enzyme [Terriglobia bacterium]|nr:aminotransferase class I/II-fold pyridoxal phosphate-dependent enzyme [Terriglobia bacterium]